MLLVDHGKLNISIICRLHILTSMKEIISVDRKKGVLARNTDYASCVSYMVSHCYYLMSNEHRLCFTVCGFYGKE
jgi:hypothetical protein